MERIFDGNVNPNSRPIVEWNNLYNKFGNNMAVPLDFSYLWDRLADALLDLARKKEKMIRLPGVGRLYLKKRMIGHVYEFEPSEALKIVLENKA